jgi:hypothetical protein
MASYGQLNDYQSQCRQQLLRLRILAGSQDGTALSWEFTAEVRDATNAVIAEVEAMSRTAIRASEQREPQAETFLWVRVARLAAAADRAVDAARSRDVPALRAHLQQFDTLTSALWAVQDATYGKQRDSSPRRGSNLRRSGQASRGHVPRASVATMRALLVCIRFSAWSKTIEAGDSKTSSVTSTSDSGFAQ